MHICDMFDEDGTEGLASSAQPHREDEPTSSLGHVCMRKEQCAVVVSLLYVGGGGGGGGARHSTIKQMG